MAGGFDALFSQTFTSTDAITVTHNLDRVVFAVRVLIGDVARNDLVQTITPSASDPRNIIEVTLTSSQSGLIQIIDSDYLWGTLPSPEGAAALQNNISGSTFSGSFSGSFFGNGSGLTGVGQTAAGNATEIQFNTGGDFDASPNLTFSGSVLKVTSSIETTSITGSLFGTASFATVAALANTASLASQVVQSLTDGTGIATFSYNGGLPSGVQVAIDDTIVVTLTGSQTLTNKIITGSFEGDLVGTASFANEVGRVENALVDGTGITTLFFDGATPGANVSIDQSIVVTLTGSQTLSNKVVSGSFSGSFVGDGSGLTGIGGGGTPGGSTTQIQYNNAGAFGGSADFTFDSSATALALTGTFNGRRYYPDSTTDPSSPTPADSDIYYNTVLDMQMIYDGARSKWLSVDSSIMEFGRNGNTGGGAYYRGPGNKAYTAARGRTAEYDGTVVSIAYTRNDLDAATFEVTADGTGIATLASSARTGKDITLDGDFSADDILGVKNQTGSNTTRGVSGWVRIRWRV